MSRIAKIFFVRDNHGTHYDAVEDSFEVFRIAQAKKLTGLSAFKVTKDGGCLTIKDPEGNEIQIYEKVFPEVTDGYELLKDVYANVVNYEQLLGRFRLTTEDLGARTLIIKDFEDSELDKAFEKIVGHYLDRDRMGCQPFYITRFKKLFSMFCLPIVYPAFDLGRQICEEYATKHRDPDFGPYQRWWNISWFILNGSREGEFIDFSSRENPRAEWMVEIVGILLMTATALFAVESKFLK